MKISVKAHPRAKQEKVAALSDNAFEIWVREIPDKGRANQAIIAALSRELKIPKSRLSIVSGLSSKNKIVEIR